MKRNIFLLFIVCGLFFAKMIAQTLPSTFEVFLPEYIYDMKGNPSGINRGQQWQEWCLSKIKNDDFGRNTKIVWTVYSDRDSNPTYTSPNNSASQNSYLNFGEKIFIAKIQNGFALVFSDVYKSEYPIINPTAQSKGWIPVENLLLWEECPKSQNQIYQKGLVVHDPSKQNALIEQNPSYLLAPDKTAVKNSNQKAKDLDILFIMKTETIGNTTYYLLSREMSINGMEQRVLYGWLPDDYVTRWDQRLVLEPTYATAAVRSYENENVKPSIFHEAKEANAMFLSGAANNPFWVYEDFSASRMDAVIMRNPILEKEKDMIYKVAAISSLSISEKAKVVYKEEIEKLKKQLDNINVIFVIDATSSMKKYYPAVASALSDILRRDFNQKIRVGAVLYKDYKDADCIIYKPITANINELSGFISSSVNNIGSIDPDDYEAMFLGLETALDINKMKYNRDQANFMILIGDAGNHRKDPNGRDWQSIVNSLSQKMSNNNINFLAYQVNNANKTAYEDFALQVGVLQKQLSEHIRKKLGIEEGGIEYKLKSNRFYTLARKNSDEFELPVYDTYKYAISGQSESTSGLQNIITSAVIDYQRIVENRLKNLENNDIGISSDGNLKETELKENLRLAGWDESKIISYISYLKQGGSTKLIGYAPEKTNSTKYKLFDYVLFFAEDELTELIQILSKLNSPNNISQKKSYQDAVISMGQAMLGHFDVSMIQNMDMDELLSQIYGVPIKIQSCGIRIDRIIHMDQLELDEYIKKFNDKLLGLKNIKGNSYNGRFTSNNITYYWIPFSEMPGFCEEK